MWIENKGDYILLVKTTYLLICVLGIIFAYI